MPITSDQVLSCVSNQDNIQFIEQYALSSFIDKNLLNQVHSEEIIPKSELWTVDSVSINSWSGLEKVNYPGKESLWAVTFDGSYSATKPGINQMHMTPKPFDDNSKISGVIWVGINMNPDGSPRLATALCVRCVRKS